MAENYYDTVVRRALEENPNGLTVREIKDYIRNMPTTYRDGPRSRRKQVPNSRQVTVCVRRLKIPVVRHERIVTRGNRRLTVKVYGCEKDD